MICAEFTAGLHQLGILHLPTLPYSPHVNGKQENLWGRIEGRLLAMLEGEERLSLEQLNRATQAWATQEYQRTRHSELGTTPVARYLAGPHVARECPDSETLRAACRSEVKRLRRHRQPRRAALRAPFPLSAPRPSRSALCPLGSDPGRSHRAAPRQAPVRPPDTAATADALRRRRFTTGRSTDSRQGLRMTQKLLARYGLKGNPFTPAVPTAGVYVAPKIENCCWRIEPAPIREGGFALLHGAPGSGKSVVMRLLAARRARLPEPTVGGIHHPPSNRGDF